MGVGFGDPKTGPPPHARGRPRSSVSSAWPWRTTSACAATSGTASGPRPLSGDHPRMRGDDRAMRSTARRHCGPPPRARGRPARCRHIDQLGRSTPACAGPRVRDVRTELRPGFTPACAGPTPPPFSNRRSRSVHPRVRGADRWTVACWMYPAGPPPRARGRHLLTRQFIARSWCFHSVKNWRVARVRPHRYREGIFPRRGVQFGSHSPPVGSCRDSTRKRPTCSFVRRERW
jgi:hypothetical protein